MQVATRAYRDNADEEMVVAALLHDIGDLLAPHNHCEVAAAILKPYVSKRTYWIIKKTMVSSSLTTTPITWAETGTPGKNTGDIPFLRLRRPSATCGTSLPSTRTTTHCPLRHLTHWCGVSFLEEPFR